MMRAFAMALITAAFPAYAADLPGCIDGHPVRRAPDCSAVMVPGCITYGWLAKRHGYQRDHYISLGLLGPDTKANVHYQQLQFALWKDGDERRADHFYCSGEKTLDDAQAWLRTRWPLDAAHGYDRE
jgi:hypothetical protein